MYENDCERYKMKMADCLRKSRQDAKKSQEYMSFELGVARKTVQNWEKGISAPDICQAFQWFKILYVSPLPYLFQYVFPSMENISAQTSDDDLKKALIMLINDLPPEGVRQLLFLLYGDHGSSPRMVLQMVTAHLQCPMKERVAHGVAITHDYKMAEAMGDIAAPDHIQPNIRMLERGIDKGMETVMKHEQAFMMEE